MTEKFIAFQGAIGANSYLACQKFYPDLQKKPLANFYDVFKAVENGEVEFGMIPLENSYAGRVSEIHNLLQESDVFIVAEHFFHVSHNLAGLANSSLEDITEVYSHPQALWQCQKNLRNLKLTTHEFSNTAKAAQYVSSNLNKNKAAICSKEAAQNNGLKILIENLQDSGGDNVTVFVVIAKNKKIFSPNQKTITAILLTIKNISGSLYQALGCFAKRDISLLKLESYIPGGVSKQANFFIAIQANPSEEKAKEALLELNNFCEKIKILGIYQADPSRLNT